MRHLELTRRMLAFIALMGVVCAAHAQPPRFRLTVAVGGAQVLDQHFVTPHAWTELETAAEPFGVGEEVTAARVTVYRPEDALALDDHPEWLDDLDWTLWRRLVFVAPAGASATLQLLVGNLNELVQAIRDANEEEEEEEEEEEKKDGRHQRKDGGDRDGDDEGGSRRGGGAGGAGAGAAGALAGAGAQVAEDGGRGCGSDGGIDAIVPGGGKRPRVHDALPAGVAQAALPLAWSRRRVHRPPFKSWSCPACAFAPAAHPGCGAAGGHRWAW